MCVRLIILPHPFSRPFRLIILPTHSPTTILPHPPHSPTHHNPPHSLTHHNYGTLAPTSAQFELLAALDGPNRETGGSSVGYVQRVVRSAAAAG